jgi:Flp pilus assembly protein TadG
MNTVPETDEPKPRRGFLRRWRDDRSGVIAIFGVVMFPVLVGIGGLAIDVSAWYLATENTQGVADAASYAGALTYQAGDTALADISNQALAVVALDGFVNPASATTTSTTTTTTTISGNTTVTVASPPADGPNAGKAGAVEVRLMQTQPQMFSAILGSFTVNSQTRAVSAANTVYCILGLSKTSATGVYFPAVLSTIDLMNNSASGCSIGTNATGLTAMSIVGLDLTLNYYTAVIGGSLSDLCPSCTITYVVKPHQNYSPTLIPDPYSARTMPTASSPTKLTTVAAGTEPATAATVGAPGPTPKTGACAYTTQITASQTLTGNACYRIAATIASSVTLTVSGTATICGGVSINSGGTLTLSGGTFKLFAPSTGSGNACTGTGTSVTVNGGTFTVNSGAIAQMVGSGGTNGLVVGSNSGSSATLTAGSSVWGTTVSGGKLTVNGSASTPPALYTLAVSGGTANLNTDVSAWSTTVSGGTLNVNAGSSNIYNLGVSGGAANILAGNSAWVPSPGITGGTLTVANSANGATTISGLTVNCGNGNSCVSLGAGNVVWKTAVTSGTLTFNSTGGTTCTFNKLAYTGCLYGLTVGGGAATLNAGDYAIVGPTGSAGITITSGALTMNSSSGSGPDANFIEGAAGSPAINMSGGSVCSVTPASGCGTMTSTSSSPINNNILAGSGNPAINMTAGTFTMGAGTNNIQGASSEPSIALTGTSAFIAADGSTDIIGGQNPTASVPGILIETNNGRCNAGESLGYGTACNQDLELGAGTYTIWEGLTDSGGSVTLNPNATSGTSALGTYIIAGGQYCMGGNSCPDGANGFTIGDLNAHDATIVLTDGKLTSDCKNTDYATYSSTGADGVNLVAPTLDNTAGIAIFQDQLAPNCGSNTIEGASFLTATGAIYFPEQALTFDGLNVIKGSGTSGGACLQIIAGTVTIEGLSIMQDQCGGVGVNLATGGLGTALAALLE